MALSHYLHGESEGEREREGRGEGERIERRRIEQRLGSLQKERGEKVKEREGGLRGHTYRVTSSAGQNIDPKNAFCEKGIAKCRHHMRDDVIQTAYRPSLAEQSQRG